MSSDAIPPTAPRMGVGTLVRHIQFGLGRIVGYEPGQYVIVFRGGDVRRVACSFDGLAVEQRAGDPDLDRIKDAVRDVLGDHGWIDVELELASRWAGGTLQLVPGKPGVKPKEIPLDAFFKKIVGIRDRLRVLEQKINAQLTLGPEEKLELQGYITRCYGSLTTFNVLFSTKESQFTGTGSPD